MVSFRVRNRVRFGVRNRVTVRDRVRDRVRVRVRIFSPTEPPKVMDGESSVRKKFAP